MSLLYCYNKGCGQKFDPENNKEDSCQFHAGGPIFHDALKSWSCCTKKSTDFSEFLSIPGCTRGFHSNIKPSPVESTKQEPTTDIDAPSQPERKPIKPPNNPDERPSVNELRVELKKTVGASLKQALDKQMENLTLNTNKTAEAGQGDIPVGTVCKNSACGKTYAGLESNNETCNYHPGGPVFHEGLKYWSCCQKKTTEFDNFLEQAGCQTGHHVWVKQKGAGEKKSCRFDWHQTGSTIIDPTKSDVKMLGTKVEINLKKGEVFHWPNLESQEVAA